MRNQHLFKSLTLEVYYYYYYYYPTEGILLIFSIRG